MKNFAPKKIYRKYTDLKRLQQILHVFVKHGFGYIIQQIRYEDHFIAKQLRKWKIVSSKPTGDHSVLTVAERLRNVLEELGPTFIKLGQILSTRPDLIPIEICQEFAKLQDQIPPVEYEKIHRLIIAQYGKEPDKIFGSFNPVPIAAASLAQVHAAQLIDGNEVIVKIQRPGIEKIIKNDIAILRQLADVVHRCIAPLRNFQFPAMVGEFAKSIFQELDFTREARNVDRFRKNFKHDPHIYVPAVYWDYTRAKVLTLEYLKGQKLRLFIETANNENKKIIASRGADAVLKQIFIDGFFHADPHPGNIFILPDNIVAFLDFGMMSRLSTSMRSNLSALLIGLAAKDIDTISSVIMELGDVNPNMVDIKSFKSDFEEFLDNYYEIPVKQIQFSEVFFSALTLIRRYNIKIPHQLYLMLRTIVILESITKELDPDFDMITHARPFVKKMIRLRHTPKTMLKDSYKIVGDIVKFIKLAPNELIQILRMMRQGLLKFEFEHHGLDSFITELDRSSNRISFSLVIAALIVGSSLIMLTNKGPMFLGYPTMGIIGYTIAAFLGFWLAIAILKSGKL